MFTMSFFQPNKVSIDDQGQFEVSNSYFRRLVAAMKTGVKPALSTKVLFLKNCVL